ncbi:proton pump-interactor 1-like [Coffea arabica]|uniref:Proton pump-interactor 1-like n=1 Tax=Coffea arabica TaxID=13443 RepID=A0ABM4VQ47_COFAR
METLTIEEKVKNAEILIDQKNEARFEIVQRLEKREFDRFHMLTELEGLSLEIENFAVNIKEPIQYLQGAVDEYKAAEEFTNQINSLFHRLKNGRNPLTEEKQILRKIKCAQEQRDKYSAYVEAKTWSHWRFPKVLLNSKESVQSHLDRLYNELEGGSKQQKAYYSGIHQLKKRLPAVERDISYLQKKLEK